MKINPQRVAELHAQQLSDREIARLLQTSPSGVRRCRHKLGLPALLRCPGPKPQRSDRRQRTQPEQRFHELTTRRIVGRDRHGGLLWECACSCGRLCVVRGTNLRSGNTRSCGHLRGRPKKSK